MKLFVATFLAVLAAAWAAAPVYRVDEEHDGVRGRYVVKIQASKISFLYIYLKKNHKLKLF